MSNSKTTLAIVNGAEHLEIENQGTYQIETKLDYIIADTFTKCISAHNALTESESRINEKFEFAVVLKRYLRRAELGEEPF